MVVFFYAVLCIMTQAQETAPRTVSPTLADMAVTGKITKVEMQTPSGNTIPRYVLTDTGGCAVMLPWKHMGPGGEQATPVNLEDYANKNVAVAGKGFQMERNGIKEVCLIKITKIGVLPATTAP